MPEEPSRTAALCPHSISPLTVSKLWMTELPISTGYHVFFFNIAFFLLLDLLGKVIGTNFLHILGTNMS